MTIYHVCGYAFESNIDFPELEEKEGLEPYISFELNSENSQNPIETEWFNYWHFPDGRVCLLFARIETGYLLRFPGLADFHIENGGKKISCSSSQGTPQVTIRHLFLDQVVPLVLSNWGKLVLHGSAVATSHGAIAFLGESGRGKSTLAASFADESCSILTDDCLLLDERGGQLVVIPSYPGVRLWGESISNLLGEETEGLRVAHYTEKKRIGRHTISFCKEPQPLCHIYLIGEREGTTPVTISPVSVRDGFMEIIRYSDRLDVNDRDKSRKDFEWLVKMSPQLNIYRLCFAREFSLLPLVRSLVMKNVERFSSGRSQS